MSVDVARSVAVRRPRRKRCDQSANGAGAAGVGQPLQPQISRRRDARTSHPFGPGVPDLPRRDGERLIILLGGGPSEGSDRILSGRGLCGKTTGAQAQRGVNDGTDSRLQGHGAGAAQREPEFRRALLQEGIECLLGGDVDTGKIVLRDYINATIGFEELGSRTARSAKSLMRMFGPTGNPQARNLLR